jgi:hypothetical protein
MRYRSFPEQPPKSPILGDFEIRNGSKSPRMGDLGGERKALRYFSTIVLQLLKPLSQTRVPLLIFNLTNGKGDRFLWAHDNR